MLISYMNLVSSKPAESLRSTEDHSYVRGEATASQTTWQREICGKVTGTSFTLQKRCKSAMSTLVGIGYHPS